MSQGAMFVLKDVYVGGDDGKKVLAAKRGEWVRRTGDCGTLGCSEEDTAVPDANKMYIPVETDHVGDYVLAPLYSLSATYDHPEIERLYMCVEPPKASKGVKTILLTCAPTEDQQEVPCQTLVKAISDGSEKRKTLADLLSMLDTAIFEFNDGKWRVRDGW